MFIKNNTSFIFSTIFAFKIKHKVQLFILKNGEDQNFLFEKSFVMKKIFVVYSTSHSREVWYEEGQSKTKRTFHIFLHIPIRLPEDFAFSVHHECAWGCRGAFLPSRYNSSRAKCIKCAYCGLFFSPNKFIFHSHRVGPGDKYVQPDAANFNSWRRHMRLSGNPPDEVTHAWEDVKAMFNGGTRKRLLSSSSSSSSSSSNPAKRARMSPSQLSPPLPVPSHPRVPPFPELPLPLSRSLVMDYVWQQHQQAAAAAAAKTPGFAFPSYALPWLTKRGPVLFPGQIRQLCYCCCSNLLNYCNFEVFIDV